jgi:hypothetical protein
MNDKAMLVHSKHRVMSWGEGRGGCGKKEDINMSRDFRKILVLIGFLRLILAGSTMAGITDGEFNTNPRSVIEPERVYNVLSIKDAIIPTSANSPPAEQAPNVLDQDSATKYLNFDKLNTGFTVTPKIGATIITGITLTSANDAPERDPASYVIEGSNSGRIFAVIAKGTVPKFKDRFIRQTFSFANGTPYTIYRVTFPTVYDASTANSMQIADVALLGRAYGAVVTEPYLEQPQFVGMVKNVDRTLTITWTGQGMLQAAPDPAGPFRDVTGATSPYTFTPKDRMMIFRLSTARLDRVVKPGKGVEVMQVDFGAKYPATEWGRVVVDHRTLTKNTGIAGGYLNVFTKKGWAVQNLPIPPFDQPQCVKYFDLGLPERSMRIKATEIKVLHSNGPVDNAEEQIAKIDFSPYEVSEWVWNPTGLGREATEIIPDRPPLTLAVRTVFKFVFSVSYYEDVTNVETAKNQCGPMAVANSLQFLENQGHITVPHNHALGLKGDNTLVGQLDTACNRSASARCSGSGVCMQDMLDGKFKYLSDNSLTTGLSHRHQGVGALCTLMPAANFAAHGITSQYDGTPLTWEWLRDRIRDGWAVEAWITWGGGGGHVVRVTGCGKRFGIPWLRYSHDAQQCNDTAGIEDVVVDLSDPDSDGHLNLDGTNDEIALFVATGP